MPPEKLAGHIETENLDVVHQELRNGRPVILLLSHIGNWELLAQLVPRYFDYAKIGTIYQKLGNRYIDAHVVRNARRPARSSSIAAKDFISRSNCFVPAD